MFRLKNPGGRKILLNYFRKAFFVFLGLYLRNQYTDTPDRLGDIGVWRKIRRCHEILKGTAKIFGKTQPKINPKNIGTRSSKLVVDVTTIRKQ